MTRNKIIIKPIGYARSKTKHHKYGGFRNAVSEIVLNKKLSSGLDNLREYSHIVVVYWMNKVNEYSLKHRPQGNPDVPVVGIFACRCPRRPNPIAISTVKLVGIQGNIIK